MPSYPLGSATDFERAIAERLGLDQSQVVAGSISVESSDAGERVTWQGLKVMPSGFTNEVIAEVRSGS